MPKTFRHYGVFLISLVHILRLAEKIGIFAAHDAGFQVIFAPCLFVNGDEVAELLDRLVYAVRGDQTFDIGIPHRKGLWVFWP